MNIRCYKTTDKEKLIALFRLLTPVYFAPEEEADFSRYLDGHATDYFVVEGGAELVACGGFNVSETIGEIKIAWDMVHPDCQGEGIGGRLLQHRIEKIQQQKNIKTIVVRTTQKADVFYAKYGFETKKIVADYWAKGFDLYHMERPLHLD
jgi:[ribosomal protein S18]-alanine N-acetyltransferase